MPVVVLLRHPVAFASSLRRLYWRFDFRNWLDQPLLMRDWLGPFEAEIREQAERPADVIEQAGLLWNVICSVADQFREQHQDWIFLRHEDLSMDPMGGFQELFERLY